jgi:hypothetical protein
LVLATSKRVAETNSSRGEAAFVTDLNYSSAILGPSLGAVSLAAFAAESFQRLGYLIALELTAPRSRQARSQGYSREQKARLADFDAAPSNKRLADFFSIARIPPSATIRRHLEALVAFRNSLAHDAPAVRLSDMTPLRAPGKRREAPKQTGFGPFDALGASNRPVRLKHAILALDIHDALVTHSLERSQLAHWAEQTRRLAGGSSPLIREALGVGLDWEPLRNLAKAWEEGPQVSLCATPEEYYQVRLALQARARMKAIK